MGKLLSYDPYTGIKEVFEGDGKGNFKIQTVQDCESIVRFNKDCQNEESLKKNGIKNDFYHFARVPLTVLLEWKTKYNLDYNKKEDLPKIEKLLSSPDYKYLRTVNRI